MSLCPAIENTTARRPSASVVASVRSELSVLLGSRLSSAADVLEQHSHGEGLPLIGKPDLVAFPVDTREVAEIVRICASFEMPVVPFGTGTSLEGHVAAVHGGVSVSMRLMNALLDVDTESMDCRVQAGVTRLQLNRELRATGLFFPIDPGADASIGGMAATRASGTAAVRYGTMRESVLGLTVVLANGEIMQTGSRARKSSTGLDLTRLFVGSEGTLGIITEVQLRLHPMAEATVAAIATFPTLSSAVGASILATAAGVQFSRVELMSEQLMRACASFAKQDHLPIGPTLFVEFDGTSPYVEEQLAIFRQAAADEGAVTFRQAADPDERTNLWKLRHQAYEATLAMRPGNKMIATDACVPISALVEAIAEAEVLVGRSGLDAPILGHIGDGNFHVNILYDHLDAAQAQAAETLAHDIARLALRYGGTCSGEHGVGYHKLSLMHEEHGGAAIEAMRAIKNALDPKGIMNPGKLYGSNPR